MAGRKTSYDITYLTPRAVYRTGILHDLAHAPDPDGPYDDNIPAICLDIDSSKLIQNPGAGLDDEYEVAGRAYNAHLELFVYLGIPDGVACEPSYQGIVNGVLNPSDARCHGTIRVWIWAGSQVDDTHTGRWALVHEQSVLTDTLIVMRNIPAGAYKVTVPDLSAGCSMEILEQHTE